MGPSRGWKAGFALGLGIVLAGAEASAQCPSTCDVEKLWFTQVSLEDAVTDYVDGWVGSEEHPPYSEAGAFMRYSLTLTAEQAADATAALAAGCPVNVNFWTRGQLLRSGAAEVGFSATIKTTLVNAIEELLLSTIDIAVDGPPTPNGNYQVEHDVEVGVALVEGDSLTVEADGMAYADAVGTTTRDHGSAYFKMYRERVSGAPVLEMCVP
jgi:hypothetical protein